MTVVGAPGPVYDITGRQIQPGDLLRSFHFRAALRRETYYLYHVACERSGFLEGIPVSNLSHPSKGGRFWMRQSTLDCIHAQIVHCDSTNTWQDRPKRKT